MVFKKKKHPDQKANEDVPIPFDNEFYSEDMEAYNREAEASRTFLSGATRDSDNGKYEYGGFFSPEVLQRRAAYMHEHRFLPDKTLRASDNWKKGIPLEVYFQSLMRHLVDFWADHEASKDPSSRINPKMMEDSLCAIMFNAEGYLYEFLKNDF